MTTGTRNYLQEATDDAASAVRNFADEILEQLLNTGKASDNLLRDYTAGYRRESHVDKWYYLIEAAELIDQLAEFEESDSGLWENRRPIEAVSICAAYTYGNAVYRKWLKLIEEINEEASNIIDDYNFRIAELDDTAGKTEKKTALEKLIAEAANNA